MQLMNEFLKSLMQKPIAKRWEKTSLSHSRHLAWPLVLMLRVPGVYFLVNFGFPFVCQERPAQTNAIVDDSAPPSVAQLAGRFREQAAAAKEVSQAASEPLSWEGAGGRGSLGQAQSRGREEV